MSAFEALSQTVSIALAPATGLGDAGRKLARDASDAAENTSGDPISQLQDAAAVAGDTAHIIQGIAGAVTGVLSLPMELANTGLALAAAIVPYPSFPAVTMGGLYVGVPHAHSHPPSLIPPAPPVPLPSLGSISLGTSVQVLIGGMPAARAGSIGMAPTCGGLIPMFNVFLGSSKVFIGGQRAARMMDVCNACTPPLCSGVAAASAALKALETAGQVAAAAGIVGDAFDAAAAPSADEAAASAISAGMAALQLAADAAASAAELMLGKDPALPPGLPGMLTLGMPNVLIGGLPIPNTADIAHRILKRLRRRRPRLAQALANALVLGPTAGCQ